MKAARVRVRMPIIVRLCEQLHDLTAALNLPEGIYRTAPKR